VARVFREGQQTPCPLHRSFGEHYNLSWQGWGGELPTCQYGWDSVKMKNYALFRMIAIKSVGSSFVIIANKTLKSVEVWWIFVRSKHGQCNNHLNSLLL